MKIGSPQTRDIAQGLLVAGALALGGCASMGTAWKCGVDFNNEALNIFNEPKATYMPIYGSSRQYHYYGSKYFIGIRARI